MARKVKSPLGLSEVESSTRRKPKFKVGDILEVLWDRRTKGLIQITEIVKMADEGEPGFYDIFYEFKHLTGSGRDGDLRGLSVVEDLLKAKLASPAAAVLYGKKS